MEIGEVLLSGLNKAKSDHAKVKAVHNPDMHSENHPISKDLKVREATLKAAELAFAKHMKGEVDSQKNSQKTQELMAQSQAEMQRAQVGSENAKTNILNKIASNAPKEDLLKHPIEGIHVVAQTSDNQLGDAKSLAKSSKSVAKTQQTK